LGGLGFLHITTFTDFDNKPIVQLPGEKINQILSVVWPGITQCSILPDRDPVRRRGREISPVIFHQEKAILISQQAPPCSIL